MIKVSFHYPYIENGRFDIDYYYTRHMPRAAELLGAALKGWSVEAGIGASPLYVASGNLLFESVEAFKAAIPPAAPELEADLANYSDGPPPAMQISEVLAEG